MELKMRIECGVLYVRVTGEFLLSEAYDLFLSKLEGVAYSRVQKVLVDGSEVRGEPKLIERFFYGEFVSRTVTAGILEGAWPGSLKFAYVLKEPILGPERFGETVAVNRGMLVKVFEDVNEAQVWLGVSLPSLAFKRP